MNDGAGADIFGDRGPDFGLFRDGDKGALTLEKGLGPVRLPLTCSVKRTIYCKSQEIPLKRQKKFLTFFTYLLYGSGVMLLNKNFESFLAFTRALLMQLLLMEDALLLFATKETLLTNLMTSSSLMAFVKWSL